MKHFLSLLTLSLCLGAAAASAQQTAPAPDAVEAVEIETIEVVPDTQPAKSEAARQEAREKTAVDAPHEEERPAPAEIKEEIVIEERTAPVEPEEHSAAPAEDIKVNVNYGALESAGILTSAREGALGKSLWQNQKRSDIVLMLDRAPLRTEMASVTALKKGVLLSQNDAGLIDNDIAPKPGYDLLTKRLYMLMDSGLYGDAYDLYTQSVEDPYHESLARAGILLNLFNADMGTACLEEKVLAPRYKQEEFWQILDAACNADMGGKGNADALRKSSVINAVFTQENYKVPAADHAALLKMTRLERGILLAQGRLDYAGIMQDVKRGKNADPALLMMYVRDKNLPSALLLPLQKEAIARGLLLPNILKKTDPEYKRISTLENPAEKAQALKAMLADEPVLAAIIPYADMIRENDEMTLDSTLSRRALSVLILAGGEIPARFIEKLDADAPSRPENYVYLQALSALGRLDKSVNIPVDKLASGANALGLQKSGQILAIIENLDKGKKLNDNPARVYEKQLGLTSVGYYVMPSVGLSEWLKTAASQQWTGSAVLTAMTMLPDRASAIYAGTMRDAVEGLQAVGLIESANKIMEEVLVSVMNNNKGE